MTMAQFVIEDSFVQHVHLEKGFHIVDDCGEYLDIQHILFRIPYEDGEIEIVEKITFVRPSPKEVDRYTYKTAYLVVVMRKPNGDHAEGPSISLTTEHAMRMCFKA